MSEKVTAESLKNLRERTGVGIAKCKDALDQAEGDIEKAIDILRKAGIASSVKKEGRETKEGLIGIAENAKAIALIEVRSETDFVTQNAAFKEFLQNLCQQAIEIKPLSLSEFLSEKFSKDPYVTVEQARNLLVQKFGENIQIKRIEVIEKISNASYGIYSHMGGKRVSLVELEGGVGEESCAREVAMHVVAESPEYLKEDEIPLEVRKREEEVVKAQAKGKEAMMEKILAGKWKAYVDQVCLKNQKFVKDPSKSILQFVEEWGKKAGKTLQLRRFWLWKIS